MTSAIAAITLAITSRRSYRVLRLGKGSFRSSDNSISLMAVLWYTSAVTLREGGSPQISSAATMRM